MFGCFRIRNLQKFSNLRTLHEYFIIVASPKVTLKSTEFSEPIAQKCRILGNPINGGPKFLYLPLNLTLTLTLTLLTLLLSTVFNMVHEFGTAFYRIAEFCSLCSAQTPARGAPLRPTHACLSVSFRLTRAPASIVIFSFFSFHYGQFLTVVSWSLSHVTERWCKY